jgi:hypothetical protein
MFVTGNHGYRNQIPEGSEILAIQGKATPVVISEVATLISWDHAPFRDELAAQPFYLSLWNDFGDFTVTYRPPGTTTDQTVSASGGLWAKLHMLLGFRALRAPYELRFPREDVALIDFRAFDDLPRFQQFLREAFTAIHDRHIHDVIIDLRANGGGNSALGEELMQYLSPTPFRMFETVLVKVGPDLQRKDLDLEPLRDEPLRFTGKSYLLTSGRTFSSATDLASAFACYHVGTIVGEETGGLTVSFGDVRTFNLPRTGMAVGSSFKHFVNACGRDDGHGVIPDRIVPAEEALDATLALITK